MACITCYTGKKNKKEIAILMYQNQMTRATCCLVIVCILIGHVGETSRNCDIRDVSHDAQRLAASRHQIISLYFKISVTREKKKKNAKRVDGGEGGF